jgi:hypothetical protein
MHFNEWLPFQDSYDLNYKLDSESQIDCFHIEWGTGKKGKEYIH